MAPAGFYDLGGIYSDLTDNCTYTTTASDSTTTGSVTYQSLSNLWEQYWRPYAQQTANQLGIMQDLGTGGSLLSNVYGPTTYRTYQTYQTTGNRVEYQPIFYGYDQGTRSYTARQIMAINGRRQVYQCSIGYDWALIENSYVRDAEQLLRDQMEKAIHDLQAHDIQEASRPPGMVGTFTQQQSEARLRERARLAEEARLATERLRRAEEERRVTEERQQRERQEREAARAIIVTRGENLLKDIVGEERYDSFRQLGYIDIPSLKDADKRYRIRSARRIGIVKRENGQWVEKPLSLCVHPSAAHHYVPGDLVATHILLAKFNEEHLEKTANLHRMAA